MKRTAERGVQRLLHLLLPPACAGCEAPLSAEGGRVCPLCRTRLKEPPHPRCTRCHAPRGTGLPASRPCPECSDWPEVLARARTAVLMASPADTLVHQLKYGGWPELAPFMAARMTRAFPTAELSAGSLVVPVPTTPSRERERGYNQAELLAERVAEVFGLPLVKALRRVDGGGTQVALHRHQRRSNVEGVFRPVDARRVEVRGSPVLLVDDVLTTGATAGAAALVLEAMGARDVHLLTFARSLPGGD